MAREVKAGQPDVVPALTDNIIAQEMLFASIMDLYVNVMALAFAVENFHQAAIGGGTLLDRGSVLSVINLSTEKQEIFLDEC